ncbi:GPP34 family phosphoprotein [Cellulomonas cellasea]|uniref:GPP34 family phosphoprotein n=1 Tax=Cellulomonas cellasea TaxID=43670 RepID=A0A7W4UI14_9CELL|nr:GPP34 family phosphoprotein [Cellulomonas cellasea]MBB2924538.1 hypothetical protein [Cellulomonas cellasea]
MILAEDVLLLLTDDVTGKPVVDTTRLDLALAGAVLLDLATAGRVDVSGPGEPVKPGRVVVRDPRPTGDGVLDEGLRRISAKGPRKPASVVPELAKKLRPELLARLVERGVLRLQEGKVLGIFPTSAWPAVDPAYEDGLRRGLHDVLVVGRTPTPREAALVSMLQGVDQVPRVLGDVGVPKRELRQRAKAVAHGGFADAAVKGAVEAVNAAVMAGVMAATVAATSAAGS